MGIVESVYDLLHWVECHYDINCTYDKIEEIPYSMKRWRRNCQCKRQLSAKIVEKNIYMRIRQEIKYGNGERWYELTWTKYQTGPTGRDWYV